MNLFKERIQFFISPVIELLSAMHRVVNHESIYEDVDSFLRMLHHLLLNEMFWCFTNSGFSPDLDFNSYDDPKEVIQ